jgi:hypothetical protein
MTTAALLEAFDNAFQKWGRAAPPVRADENERAYVERIARIAQRRGYLSYDEPVKKVDFRQLPSNALPQFTKLLIDGIKRSVMRPDTVPDNTERSVFTRDDNTGLSIRSFVRPDSFVKDPEYGHRDCRPPGLCFIGQHALSVPSTR